MIYEIRALQCTPDIDVVAIAILTKYLSSLVKLYKLDFEQGFEELLLPELQTNERHSIAVFYKN